ncbi:MAG: hypothetical protein CVU97_02380 [Firmicutes bacterium HGW-Firmicutes-21]|nr:MAG: hypothetical protein CVU97_02380 [Firmicutes bacterium HGW-Firmicutes-21]
MNNNRCPYDTQMQPNSYVRLFHASPDAPGVDVYVNNRLSARNLVYKQMTDYLTVPTGTYNVKVYPTGQRINAVINTDLLVPPNSALTVAATGKLSEITPMVIEEEYMPQINGNKAYVRFVHLSPNAPAVDITLPDGTMLFENVSYGDYTDYLEVAPGTYTLQVKPAGVDQVVLSVPNVQLSAGTVYSVYAVGLVGDEPPLEAVIVVDSMY